MLNEAILGDKDKEISEFFADEQNEKWLNSQNGQGVSPLMIAAMHNSKKSAQALLKLGASVNAVNNNEDSALLTGIKNYGDVELVELLVKSGSDPKGKNKWKEDALSNARSMFQYNKSDFESRQNKDSKFAKERLAGMERYQAIIKFLEQNEKESQQK